MAFEDLNLHPNILKALKKAGYETPTEVQARAIPEIISGGDLRVSAQTGTGKTAAFLLPAIQKLLTSEAPKTKHPKILVLVPTRELGMQITDQAKKYSSAVNGLKTVSISGGVGYQHQLRKLSKAHDILIATPGRLLDLIEKKKINLSAIEMLILDEADRMLDMGFVEPVREIVSHTPEDRQTLLFSATLRGGVIDLSEELLDEPSEIVVHAETQKHENIEQHLHFVDNIKHKNQILDHILDASNLDTAIIFTSTKRQADQLSMQLKDKGYRSAALHGDMRQRERTRTIMRLKDGKIKVLVATDVAARGIDMQSISHVVNFDLPRNVEDYVHRIGRTGRAGAKGEAFSFADASERMLVKRIEKYTGQPITVVEIPGLEPKPFKKVPQKEANKGYGRKRGGRPFAKKKFNSKGPFGRKPTARRSSRAR